MRKQKGFTLVELLVVIAIIGMLSTLAVVALNSARAKGRDARRLSDIKQIQTALEMYYNDCSQYPDDDGGLTADDATGCTGATTFGTYIPTVPTDPTNSGSSVYTYVSTALTTYDITYVLEGSAGGIIQGTHHATPKSISDD